MPLLHTPLADNNLRIARKRPTKPLLSAVVSENTGKRSDGIFFRYS
jgi:hypothetical protein